MAVIESKGDGYALYGGVKLPKLSEVEVEHDTLDGELPYQFVFRNDSNDFYVFFSNKPFLVEYDSFGTYGFYTLYDWYWDSENLILNGSGYATSGEFPISNFEPIWSNHDIINNDDGDSVYFPASEDPIPLDGMNVIEWDGVNEPPYWDGSRDGPGMWDYSDGNVRLAPYAEASNAIAVIGGEAYTYTYIDTDYWEVCESFEAWDEGDHERKGAYASGDYGICAIDRYYDSSVYTSLIAYTPVEEPTTVDYTLTYSTAHGTAPSTKTVTVNEGESYALTAADLPIIMAEGYVFGGWTLNGVIANVGDTISANATLVAVWEKEVTDFDWDSFVKGYKVGAALRRKRVVG